MRLRKSLVFKRRFNMIDYLIAEWEAVNADEWVKYECGGCGIE